MLWFRTTDNRFVRYWCHRDRLLDKSIEEFATTTGRPPVEPECEFVQVIVEMFTTHRSLVRAEQPALQQRRHPMNSWHQLRGRFLLPPEKGDPVSISSGFHWIVSKPAIRVDGTTRLDSLLHKGEQTLRRRVAYAAHPDASNSRAILFRSNDNQGLGFRLSPASALFQTSNIGLVHLDCAREPIASRTHHRPPQFVQPRPSCLVTSQSQHPLQAQGTGSVLLTGDPPHGSKPQDERLASILEYRPGRDRRLISAGGALQQNRSQRPRPGPAATRAAITVRPAQSKQVVTAGGLVSESGLELGQILRVILHRLLYNILGSPESSKYPIITILRSLTDIEYVKSKSPDEVNR